MIMTAAARGLACILLMRRMNTVADQERIMQRSLCLTRECMGLMTRIECVIRPLPHDNGQWLVLFAAGMAQEQPSAIKSQGPFNGMPEAQSVLTSILENLSLHGYRCLDDVPIWSLHMQAELRRIGGDGAVCQRSSLF
ncbi:hypothetical protein ALP99_02672 [Pseudomonas syringae pv. tomato]|uniref:Uncharacterized protein n=3 Tax=Pseudomonas syringae group TaxID=136849 RepID=A0A3M3N3K6_9PSED|nr:Uncharacterized protein ALO88_01277 [Pseudomonas syringae pv. antirrhini]RMN54368.1 hypothetical protein ALQ58_04241 [Pseudomonas syringae pv. apii]RMO90624.1 hypothetical protein ALQ32_00292 [Pseudomonas syringae pv. tagetis]RMQ70982.1 hypothetical protein ALP99_02672 [Pseudomonas syringae pv. tomato]RMN94268.1 hypothetical protein ALQ49_01178 [Pseudomonas syringae pv. apii]